MLPTKNELGYPILGWVYGMPGHRCVQCPHCGEPVYLPRGKFRGEIFQHTPCGGWFEIYWNAGIKQRC